MLTDGEPTEGKQLEGGLGRYDLFIPEGIQASLGSQALGILLGVRKAQGKGKY